MEGTIHIYDSRVSLPLFAYKNGAPNEPANLVLVFIGGMLDSWIDVPYVPVLAELFAKSPTSRLVHLELASSRKQWGFHTISRDVSNIISALKFIRSSRSKVGHEKTKIILLGHGTGCQDVLSYMSVDKGSPIIQERPKIQGAILHAPVSNRDWISYAISSMESRKDRYKQCLEKYHATPPEERDLTILPMFWTQAVFGAGPLSLTRFWSMASPESPENPSPDDMFSADCTDKRLQETFGRAVSELSPLQNGNPTPQWPQFPLKKKQICVVIGGADDWYPPHVDKAAFVPRWRTFAEAAGGEIYESRYLKPTGVVDNADHTFTGDDFNARTARDMIFRRIIIDYIRELCDDKDMRDAYSVLNATERVLEKEKEDKMFGPGGTWYQERDRQWQRLREEEEARQRNQAS